MKKCKKCGEDKLLTDYYVVFGNRDGRSGKCKECTKNYMKIGRIEKSCSVCGVKFKTFATEIKRGGGLTCSRLCFFERLRKIIKREENSPNWKGDKVGRAALHNWVERQLGKPKKCEHCGTTNAKKFDWANKSQKYQRNVSDWIRLCRKCHAKYDYKARHKKWVKSVKKLGWRVKD